MTDAQGGITTYGYDLDNNRTSITDADGNLTQFASDRRNRLVGETDPLGNTITLQYDPVNNVESRTDRDGQHDHGHVQRPGRAARRDLDFGAGGATDNEILYAYDGDGNLLSVTDHSSGSSTPTPAAIRWRRWTTAARPRARRSRLHLRPGRQRPGDDRSHQRPGGHDRLLHNGRARPCGPNHTGRQRCRRQERGDHVQPGRRARDDRPLRGRRRHARGGPEQYTYDDLDRLTDLADSDGATPVTNYLYTFDGDGRVSQVTDGDGTTDYTYDNIDQLLAADHNTPADPAETYTYDSNGNRVTSGTQATTDQIGTDNRVASDGTYTYTYDKEGNLTQQKEIATNNVRIFQWDLRNRLTAVIDKDAAGHVTQEVLFTYDVFNDRIADRGQAGRERRGDRLHPRPGQPAAGLRRPGRCGRPGCAGGGHALLERARGGRGVRPGGRIRPGVVAADG